MPTNRRKMSRNKLRRKRQARKQARRAARRAMAAMYDAVGVEPFEVLVQPEPGGPVYRVVRNSMWT